MTEHPLILAIKGATNTEIRAGLIIAPDGRSVRCCPRCLKWDFIHKKDGLCFVCSVLPETDRHGRSEL